MVTDEVFERAPVEASLIAFTGCLVVPQGLVCRASSLVPAPHSPPVPPSPPPPSAN